MRPRRSVRRVRTDLWRTISEHVNSRAVRSDLHAETRAGRSAGEVEGCSDGARGFEEIMMGDRTPKCGPAGAPQEVEGCSDGARGLEEIWRGERTPKCGPAEAPREVEGCPDGARGLEETMRGEQTPKCGPAEASA